MSVFLSDVPIVSGRRNVHTKLIRTRMAIIRLIAQPPKVAISTPALVGGIALPMIPPRLKARPAPV